MIVLLGHPGNICPVDGPLRGSIGPENFPARDAVARLLRMNGRHDRNGLLINAAVERASAPRALPRGNSNHGAVDRTTPSPQENHRPAKLPFQPIGEFVSDVPIGFGR
jgi:hypothetical protein